MQKFGVGYVYLITNLVNNKKYVGKTEKSLSVRWHGHVKDAKSGSHNTLHKAIRKYGADKFAITELAKCTTPLLSFMECKFIADLGTHSRSHYNMTPGGDGVPMTLSMRRKIAKANTGKVLSIEQRAKMSVSQRAAFSNPEILAKRTAAVQYAWDTDNGGFRAKHTEATRKSWTSVRRKEYSDRWNDQVFRAKCLEARKATCASIEHRELLSKRGKENWSKPEFVEKMRRATKRRWNDPVAHQRQSEAQLRRFSKPEEKTKLSFAQSARFVKQEERDKMASSLSKFSSKNRRVKVFA